MTLRKTVSVALLVVLALAAPIAPYFLMNSQVTAIADGSDPPPPPIGTEGYVLLADGSDPPPPPIGTPAGV